MIRLLVLASFAAALAAQQPVPPPNPQGTEESNQGDEGTRRKKEAELRGEIADEGKEAMLAKELDALNRLTPEERLARNVTHGFGSFARVHTGLKPSRLMPGQTGKLTIIVAFLGDTVVPSPPPVTMLSATQQGALTMGAFAFQPAKEAKLAKGFVGRPVYDNYLAIELPVTVAASAAMHSKHPVKVDFQVDLYSGTSGTVMGRFVDSAAHVVEVGPSPDPAVSFANPPANGGTAAPEPRGHAAEETREPVRSAEPEPAPIRAADGDDVAVAPAPVAPQDRSGGGSPIPEVEATGGFSPMLLIGGGAVVLLVLVMLLARKR